MECLVSGLVGRGLYSLVDWNHIRKEARYLFPASRLIQPRGLKCSTVCVFNRAVSRRGLYSLVDWNFMLHIFHLMLIQCRGLYSLVDWNFAGMYHSTSERRSRLIQPRGLKLLSGFRGTITTCRGLYSLVDWNLCKAVILPAVFVEAYTASWIEI